MKFRFLNDYENMPLVKYDELEDKGIRTVKYSDLGKIACDGVLKSCVQRDGELIQQYTENGNHVGVIAATRLGKTTSYVIPTILSFAKQRVKKPLIIADPKGEVYRMTAETLRREGYNVKLINFRDSRHSETWNPITPAFRKYMKVLNILDEVQLVTDGDTPKNMFNGKIYDNQQELEEDIELERRLRLDDVENEIDSLVIMLVPPNDKVTDRSWEDGARDLLKAFLHAMLEDVTDKENPITENTYSIRTVLEILATFSVKSGNEAIDDGGYFSSRSDDSNAKRLAAPLILWTRRPTAASYLSSLNVAIHTYREATTKVITSCNSFEYEELTAGPIALFINFRDEIKAQYALISCFVQGAYKYLIECANKNPNGKLDVPFYFILDEFGNFPKIPDFETTISACAGRNIWFILIIQSYAQLSAVYDKVDKIIRDNLNVHVFFGSNNPETLEAFSKECGQRTKLSPSSALVGNGPEITNYTFERISLMPVSKLARFEPGECVITEANCGYVMFSKLERYFECEEFKNLPLSNVSDYKGTLNSFSDKYVYKRKPKKYGYGY